MLRYSPLNWALVAKAKNAAKAEHLGLMVCAVLPDSVFRCTFAEVAFDVY